MSGRIDFHEVRDGDEDDWGHVCLCKDEDMADLIIDALNKTSHPDTVFYKHHIEIVAEVDLDVRDY